MLYVPRFQCKNVTTNLVLWIDQVVYIYSYWTLNMAIFKCCLRDVLNRLLGSNSLYRKE